MTTCIYSTIGSLITKELQKLLTEDFWTKKLFHNFHIKFLLPYRYGGAEGRYNGQQAPH